MKNAVPLCAAAAVALALVAFPELLLAQPAPAPVPPPAQVPAPSVINYGVALGWLQPYIQDAVAVLFLTAASWLAWLLKNKLGIDIDRAQAEVYLRAAKNQAASLIADGFVRIEKDGKVTVANANLANAANELLKSVPDAASHFNLKPADVAAKIVDMVPQVPAAPTVVVAPASGRG